MWKSKLTTISLACLAMWLLFLTAFGNNGLLHLYELNNNRKGLEAKNRELSSDIAKYDQKIFAIKKSEFELERQAREELGLAKSDEVIYLFPENQSE